jgi:hypothetical protein
MTPSHRQVFLVYIPCHVDHERARKNALKIRNQFIEKPKAGILK